MPLINFISNKHDLLQAIADGGKLFRTTPNGGEEWWLKREGKTNLRVLATTARAADRKSLIEPTGALYWRLTQAGKDELAKRSAKVAA